MLVFNKVCIVKVSNTLDQPVTVRFFSEIHKDNIVRLPTIECENTDQYKNITIALKLKKANIMEVIIRPVQDEPQPKSLKSFQQIVLHLEGQNFKFKMPAHTAAMFYLYTYFIKPE